MGKKFAAVEIDETNYWEGPIKQAAGKIFGIYVYDPDECTFLCELTPSHYLEPIGAESENSLSDEQYEEMTEVFAGTDPFYQHCRDVEKLPHAWVELDDDATLDDAREYFCGNSPAFPKD